MKTIYVSIGNTDDKLSQKEWSRFVDDVTIALAGTAVEVYGTWFSSPKEPWQNACFGFKVQDDDVEFMKERLRKIAKKYEQNSIAWAEAQVTMLRPEGG